MTFVDDGFGAGRGGRYMVYVIFCVKFLYCVAFWGALKGGRRRAD
jgi:hypothetical protein